MKLKSSVGMSFWLVMCVFLCYQQLAEMALQDQMSLPTASAEKDPLKNKCADWEIYDGADCVCAKDDKMCNGDSGVVCDDSGGHYKSKCHYAVQACNQNTDFLSSLISCGHCKMVLLTVDKEAQKGSKIAAFLRKGSSNGLSTRYQSILDNNVELFYVHESGTWAIGQTNSSGSFISMIQMVKASAPQDGNPGMLVPYDTGSEIKWKFDQTYSIKCAEDIKTDKRQKRFLFTFLVALVVTATVATTALKVAQYARGCLYYPSVCKMRDNIKKRLLPGLERDKARFIKTYGNPKEFSIVIDDIHLQIMDFKDRVIRIKELQVSLNDSVSSISELFPLFEYEFPEIVSELTEYDEFVSSLKIATIVQTNLLLPSIALEILGYLTAMESAIAFAVTVIGLVIGFAYAIVDVVSSVKEERNVRDQLREKENQLIKARQNLNNAFVEMKKFQKSFCKYIIPLLYDISLKGKSFYQQFATLHKYMLDNFSGSNDRCVNKEVISNINLNNLNIISKQLLPQIISLLSKSEKELKKKINQVTETHALIKEITRRIQQSKESPTEVYRFIKVNKPVMLKKTFSNFFDLLKLVSDTILQNHTCFWGHDLESIRNGSTTLNNYMEMPICNSSEINSLTMTIRIGVQNQNPPCKIARQIKGDVFKSIYHVIRFIADYVLPCNECYWGYNLDYIRTTHYDVNITSAKIDSDILDTLQVMDGSPINLAKEIMTKTYGISSDHWKHFILCRWWKKEDALKELNCPQADTCIPSIKTNEFC